MDMIHNHGIDDTLALPLMSLKHLGLDVCINASCVKNASSSLSLPDPLGDTDVSEKLVGWFVSDS